VAAAAAGTCVAHLLCVAAKTEILRELEQRELLLPDRLHAAIDANSRAKYYLSLLQVARAHADEPDAAAVDLHADRERCAIADAFLDGVPATSRLERDDRYQIPHACTVVSRALADVDQMIEPLRLAQADGTNAFETRLRELSSLLPTDSDALEREQLAVLTSSDRSVRDSVHLLVMDVHKALYALEVRLAPESIDGANVYGLLPEDRPLVAAFVRGVRSTEALKFEHPGLTTAATRSGDRLLIENDIGETAAHVLVVQVEGPRIQILHTDVHLQRLRFFQGLFAAFPVQWQDTRARTARMLGEDFFYECVGTLSLADPAGRETFLEQVGSRLVFLIDWNRARKQLGAFVGKAQALALLGRAAADNLGHRGFLAMGGQQLVYEAMAAVLRTPLRFGERLDDVLGSDVATGFLQVTLRVTAEGLLKGRSRALLVEQVRAELAEACLLQGDRLLGPALEHAAVVGELASALRDLTRTWAGDRAALARAAKERESRADAIVVEMRDLVGRTPGHAAFRRMIEEADDAADAIEEATFLLSLAEGAATLDEAFRRAVAGLGGLVASASDAYTQSLEAARHVRRGADLRSTYAFLDAVERVVSSEHAMDQAEREAIAGLVRAEAQDARSLILASRIASELEHAADALLRAALVLREHMLHDAR
jgi:uncharacterized protein Yka (UPF0111/DUF47 family)